MKYYSETLDKLFDDEEKLFEAEKQAEEEKKQREIELAKKKELAEIKRKERAEDAKEVEEAFKAVKEAEDEYYKKLTDFINKHGYYHYSSKDVGDFPSVFSLFKPFFTDWF